MGLGKTVVNLAALDNKFTECSCRATLVVAPLNVANLTWAMEAEKWDFSQYMKMFNLRDILMKPKNKKGEAYRAKRWHDFKTKQYEIYVINFDILPRLVELMKTLDKIPFDHLIMDESTMIKNHSGVWMEGKYAKNSRGGRGKKLKSGFRDLLGHFNERHLLTGTIIPNTYLDLFAQVRVLDGGKALGANITQYRRRHFEQAPYCEHKWVLKGQLLVEEEERKKSPNTTLIAQGNKEIDYHKSLIHESISGLTITLKAEDHLDLPDIEFNDHYIEIPTKVRKFYEELEKEAIINLTNYRKELELCTTDEEVEASNAGVLVGKLLQIASGNIFDKEIVEVTESGKVKLIRSKTAQKLHTKKLEKLQQLVRHYNKKGLSVLVATSYTHSMDDITKAIDCTVFNQGDKRKNLDNWNQGKIQCLVSNYASISHGLNLQDGGHVIVWYGPTYDFDRYKQFNARLHRTGQKHGVIVHRIIARGTIDEIALESLRHKGGAQIGLVEAMKALEFTRRKDLRDVA